MQPSWGRTVPKVNAQLATPFPTTASVRARCASTAMPGGLAVPCWWWFAQYSTGEGGAPGLACICEVVARARRYRAPSWHHFLLCVALPAVAVARTVAQSATLACLQAPLPVSHSCDRGILGGGGIFVDVGVQVFVSPSGCSVCCLCGTRVVFGTMGCHQSKVSVATAAPGDSPPPASPSVIVVKPGPSSPSVSTAVGEFPNNHPVRDACCLTGGWASGETACGPPSSRHGYP